MSAAAVEQVELFDAAPDAAGTTPAWAWIAVDPEGRCVGVADSFRQCIEAAREAPDVVLDQVVRVPADSVRMGIYWSAIAVTVRVGEPLEVEFP